MSGTTSETPPETPPEPTYVVPYLIVDRASDAIDFYTRAFGAVEQMRMPAPDGRLLHAAILIGDGVVYLCDDFGEREDGMGAPTSLGGSTVTLYRHVPDCDAAIKQAVDAGAELVMEPMDMFWGDRFGKVRDPFGHDWSISTHMRDVSPEEMQAAAAEMDWDSVGGADGS